MFGLIILSNWFENCLQICQVELNEPEFSGLNHAFTGFDCNGISNSGKDKMLESIMENYRLMNPVYIGDTESDRMAALSAGVYFLPVIYGFGDPSFNDRSFNSFNEIVSFFL